MSKEILVDKAALFKVLTALIGSAHILNEMVYLQKRVRYSAIIYDWRD